MSCKIVVYGAVREPLHCSNCWRFEFIFLEDGTIVDDPLL